MVGRHKLWIAVFSLYVVSCGAVASFQYKAYVMDADSYKGALRGPTAKDDLDLATCTPKAGAKDPCYVLLKSEYYRMKSDYLTIQQELIDLQKKCPTISGSLAKP